MEIKSNDNIDFQSGTYSIFTMRINKQKYFTCQVTGINNS